MTFTRTGYRILGTVRGVPKAFPASRRRGYPTSGRLDIDFLLDLFRGRIGDGR